MYIRVLQLYYKRNVSTKVRRKESTYNYKYQGRRYDFNGNNKNQQRERR